MTVSLRISLLFSHFSQKTERFYIVWRKDAGCDSWRQNEGKNRGGAKRTTARENMPVNAKKGGRQEESGAEAKKTGRKSGGNPAFGREMVKKRNAGKSGERSRCGRTDGYRMFAIKLHRGNIWLGFYIIKKEKRACGEGGRSPDYSTGGQPVTQSEAGERCLPLWVEERRFLCVLPCFSHCEAVGQPLSIYNRCLNNPSN